MLTEYLRALVTLSYRTIDVYLAYPGGDAATNFQTQSHVALAQAN